MEAQEGGRVSVGITSYQLTKRLGVEYGLSWLQLLRFEEAICRPEDSWTFKKWVQHLQENKFSDDEIISIARKRLEVEAQKTAVGGLKNVRLVCNYA